jgi:hypothetical protein
MLNFNFLSLSSGGEPKLACFYDVLILRPFLLVRYHHSSFKIARKPLAISHTTLEEY